MGSEHRNRKLKRWGGGGRERRDGHKTIDRREEQNGGKCLNGFLRKAVFWKTQAKL